MKIIKNIKTLKTFEKKYNMVFDKTYKYCINEGSFNEGSFEKENGYRLSYFSGCFYPYLVKKI